MRRVILFLALFATTSASASKRIPTYTKDHFYVVCIAKPSEDTFIAICEEKGSCDMLGAITEKGCIWLPYVQVIGQERT